MHRGVSYGVHKHVSSESMVAGLCVCGCMSGPSLICLLSRQVLLLLLLNTGTSSHILPHILSVLDHIGVLVAFSKVEGPSTVVTFLGVVVDSDRFELRLTQDKIVHIHDL